MVTETEIQDAIGLIYDAGLDPAAWTAALEHIAATLVTDSAAVVLLAPRVEAGFMAHVRVDPQAIEACVSRYHAHDPVLAALRARPPGQAITDQVACPKAELWRGRFHGEWCRPAGLEHAVMALPFRKAGGTGTIAVSRSHRREAFDAPEVALVATLLPHLARALRVQMRLQAAGLERDTITDALDHVAQAVLLVDARARVVHANRSAVGLLRAQGGLDVDAGCLRADWPWQTRALRVLVARLHRGRRGRPRA